MSDLVVTEQPAVKFTVRYANEPWRNRSFKVRGICKCDVLNPCWDNRKSDIPGRHWGGGPACVPCTIAAQRARPVHTNMAGA